MPEMEIRHFEARANVEKREIIGLAVPYGEMADLGGGVKERFEPGAIESVEDVKLFYGHEDPIGKVLEGKDTEAGFETG
jgi:phage head maturation protease